MLFVIAVMMLSFCFFSFLLLLLHDDDDDDDAIEREDATKRRVGKKMHDTTCLTETGVVCLAKS
jgi:hypothetical protein